MNPFLYQGDVILVYKFAYILNKPRVNDIVIVKDPENKQDKKYIIKRIAKIRNGSMYLLGDNEFESRDSRIYGWIEQKKILGKMIRKL